MKKYLVFLDELFFSDGENYYTKFVSFKFFEEFFKNFAVDLTLSFPTKFVSHNSSLEKMLSVPNTLKVVPLPYWDSIISYYSKSIFLKRKIRTIFSDELIDNFDGIILRLPSPAGSFLGRMFSTRGKKVIAIVVSDISEVYKTYSFPMNILAFLLGKVIRKEELSLDASFFVVGKTLLDKFSEKNPIHFIDSLVREKSLRIPRCGLEERINILYVGRLIPSKGVELLIEAVGNLRKVVSSEIMLNIVGFGPLEDKIKKLQSTLSFLKFWGLVSDRRLLEHIYESNHIFVLPTINYSEGFPRVILEAWAKGLYVLSSNIDSLKSLAVEDENILFFRRGDKDSLVFKLKLLIESKTLQERLCRGILKVQNKITFEYYSNLLYKAMQEEEDEIFAKLS